MRPLRLVLFERLAQAFGGLAEREGFDPPIRYPYAAFECGAFTILNGRKGSNFGLIAFVRHRAWPPNVGMIVGPVRFNANHKMIPTG